MNRNEWAIELPSVRIDGTGFSIPVHEFRGSSEHLTTVLVAGINGDKPLASLALREVIRRLEECAEINGTVLVIPSVNPFGSQGGTRHNPDLLELNRRFPGKNYGFITDQIANAVYQALVDRIDAVVDLHSGTPSRCLHYAYEYGDLNFAASFGYLPVVSRRAVPGQLCTAMAANGKKAVLAEFGGASRSDTLVGVEGCLNVLRYMGHLKDAPTGPSRVPVIEHVKVFLASFEGVLCSDFEPDHVGQSINSSVVASIVNIVSGEVMENFIVDLKGQIAGLGKGYDLWGSAVQQEFIVTDSPLLLLANAVPSMIHAGDFASLIGYVGSWIDK